MKASSDHSRSDVNLPDARARQMMASIARFQAPSPGASIWQLVNSFALFALVSWCAWWSVESSQPYLLTLVLAVVGGLVLLRVFIIQHDCGHGSFFASRRANDIVGTLCSFFTLIPYFYWRRQHAIHHASNGNLDQRGHGDMDVMTVREYLARGKFDRLRYRIYRHPFGYLVLGPIFFFLYINRFVLDRKKTSRRERANVYWTNAGLVLIAVGLGSWIGWGTLALIALPMIYVAGAAGIWIFYIQHQFEHTYWRPDAEWDYTTAALQGSSFYRLPKVLQWFTGNIGYHHIHHLKPLIPNYLLEACHEQHPELHGVPTLTLGSSLRTMFLILWDEEQQRLISFSEFKKRYAGASSQAPVSSEPPPIVSMPPLIAHEEQSA